MSQQALLQNYPVFLFFEQGLERKYAEQTSVWVERFPGPITIQVIDPPVLVKPSADGLLNWLDTFNLLGKLREKKEIPHSAFVFLLTKTPIEHNW